MPTKPKRAPADVDLKKENAALRLELTEALERQTAASEVLQVIPDVLADPEIRSIVDAVEVDDKAIRIIGSKDVLQAVIAGKQIANGNARGFARKWRAEEDESENCYVMVIPINLR